MVVGRKTYSEMIGWFESRTPIVVTRNADGITEPVKTAKSIESAIDMAKENQVEELVVSGGGEIYKAALPLVDKMIITRVEMDVLEKGFVQFPDVDWQQCSWIHLSVGLRMRKMSIRCRWRSGKGDKLLEGCLN